MCDYDTSDHCDLCYVIVYLWFGLVGKNYSSIFYGLV